MVAFDDAGKYITEAFIVYEVNQCGLFGALVAQNGTHNHPFWTDAVTMYSRQLELRFKIIYRSGQCLSFLGEDT
jgi:hypothetical protein